MARMARSKKEEARMARRVEVRRKKLEWLHYTNSEARGRALGQQRSAGARLRTTEDVCGGAGGAVTVYIGGARRSTFAH